MTAEKLLRQSTVCSLMDVVPRTLDRWCKDPKLDFPDPVIIHGRKFWRERQIAEFQRARTQSDPVREVA